MVRSYLDLYATLLRTKIGWEMSEKDSIRNMMKEIFSTNGNNVEVISRSKSQKLNHSADTVFIIPRGVCLKFGLNFSLGHTEIDIFLKKASNYNIMLVYPDMLFNGFLIHNGGTNNAQISIYSSDFNEYEAFQIYHVNMIGKTNSPSVNGCTKNCSKFKNCLDSHVKKTFIREEIN